jgi:hypothetical protein
LLLVSDLTSFESRFSKKRFFKNPCPEENTIQFPSGERQGCSSFFGVTAVIGKF